MKRILLVIEDYSELTQLESLLKKVGFDCIGCQNELQVQDFLLSFNPQVMIINGRGGKIQGVRVIPKIRKKYPQLRNIFLVDTMGEISPAEADTLQIEVVLQRPIYPLDLLEVLCDLLEIPSDPVLTKFEKLGVTSLQDFSQNSSPKIKLDQLQAAEILDGAKEKLDKKKRAQEKFLNSLPPIKQNGLPKSHVQQQVQEFRDSSEGDPEIEAIDEERQLFVVELMKMAKEKKENG